MLTTPFPRLGRKRSRTVYAQLDLFSVVDAPKPYVHNCQTCGLVGCGLTSCEFSERGPRDPDRSAAFFGARTGGAGASNPDSGEGSKNLYVLVTRKGSLDFRDKTPEISKAGAQNMDFEGVAKC